MMANVDTNQVYKVKTSIYDVAITAQGKLLMNEGNQFAYYSTDTLDIDTRLTYDGTHTDRTTGEWYSRSMEASTSADGRYVAYLGFGSSRVYVYDTTANTGGQFFYEASAKFEHPRLSPDGQSVLVGGYGDLWLLTPGNQYRQVTDSGHLTSPDW
jgi:Tol biopolymer transport system component